MIQSLLSLCSSWFQATSHDGRFHVDDISTMRTRDLKNFLVQKMHLDSKVISKIIDKAELRNLAQHYAHEINTNADIDSRMLIFYIGIACFTLVFLFCRNKSHILSAINYLSRSSSTFITYELRLYIKFNTILKSIRKFKFVEAMMILITILIDISIIYINISTIFSWVLSRSSSIRKYFLPTLSLSLSPSMLARNSSNGFGQQGNLNKFLYYR